MFKSYQFIYYDFFYLFTFLCNIFWMNTKTLFGVLDSRKRRCHLIGCNHLLKKVSSRSRKMEKCNISRLGLVSVSKNCFTEVLVSSQSRKFDKILVLVSSRSRDFDQAWYRSRLTLLWLRGILDLLLRGSQTSLLSRSLQVLVPNTR